MTYVWCLRELKRAVGAPTHGKDFEISGVSIDSRTTQKGDVFIALKGETDGHRFVQSAFEKGAVAAVVDHAVDCEIEQVVVADTFEALNKMGDAQRSWTEGVKRVAITGSCGKTSVKEMLGAALKCHKSEASYNNHIGVPLTLARMPRDAKFAVFEVGMNHPGEIKPLAELVRPHLAIITAIAPAHIGAFESVNDIAVEKISITEGLADKSQLIVPFPVYETYKAYFDCKPMTVSLDDMADADVKLISRATSFTGQTLELDVMGESVTVSLSMVGEHHVLNTLLVMAAVKQLNGDLKRAAANLELLEPVAGRGKVHDVNGIYVVDDSYNANPESMRAALASFKERKAVQRRVAILGQMLELGEQSAELHASLAPYCDGLDTVICVGAHMKALYDVLPETIQKSYFETAKDVNVQKLARQLEDGDAVMVKGSKGTFWIWDFVPKLIKEIETLAPQGQLKKQG